MTPPISIDGTDITGATIDGTDVQEITVDGDTVFSATTIIDDFESGNLNNYSGEKSSYSINSTNPISGSFSLSGAGRNEYIYSTSGLANYPSAGDTISYTYRYTGSANIFSGLAFGVQDPNEENNYCVKLVHSQNFSEIRLNKDSGAGSAGAFQVGNSISNVPANDIIKIEIDWGTNGIIQIDVTNESTSSSLGSVTANDTDYSSGGIGFHTSEASLNLPDASTQIYDDVIIL